MANLGWCAESNVAPVAASRTNFLARFCFALFASLTGFSSVPSSAAIAANTDQEYLIKAAFVLNFASLIEWPSESFGDSESPIIICHAGSSETTSLFETAYSGRLVESRPIEIRQLSPGESVSGCHIVLITAERSEQVSEFIAAVAGKSILTIGETENFAREGGVIGFYKDGSKVRFEVNRSAAASAKLHISSRLLQLARLISSENE